MSKKREDPIQHIFQGTAAFNTIRMLSSKASRKMRKKQKSVPANLPASLTKREKIKLWVGFFTVVIAMGILYHGICVRDQKSAIRKTVEKWKVTYHIDEHQAARIRQIEYDYHGSGSPFSIHAKHNVEEERLHHKEIADIMSAQDGARFLKVMEKEAEKSLH